MAIIFMDGFDKYGPGNTNSASTQALLQSGEWTTSHPSSNNIVAGISSTGQALQIAYTAGASLSKTFSASYPRIIGGIRFTLVILGTGVNCGFSFTDAGTAQFSFTINVTTGLLSLRTGNVVGTALATSASPITVGSSHYLEWDVTLGNSASYQVWLDGAVLFSGTGDTTATANNTVNGIVFTSASGGQTHTYDDLYLFDTTGSTNNAVLLTSPRIETTFPSSDSATIQFGFGAGILGSSVTRTSSTSGFATINGLFLKKFTPAVNCSLNSIQIYLATNPTIGLRGLVYADNGGIPETLIVFSTVVTGSTAGIPVLLPLTSSISLVAGTPYWIGLMHDFVMSSGVPLIDNTLSFYHATAPFVLGSPSTAPAMTSGFSNFILWGNLTSSAVNYDQINNQPPDGQYSNVIDNVVGHEDLYSFTTLSQPLPAIIHSVAVKAYAQKSDSGVSTISLRMKSGAVDSGGSLTGQALGTSFAWFSSYFPTDPNTSTAWTGATLNAALSGFKIDTLIVANPFLSKKGRRELSRKERPGARIAELMRLTQTPLVAPTNMLISDLVREALVSSSSSSVTQVSGLVREALLSGIGGPNGAGAGGGGGGAAGLFGGGEAGQDGQPSGIGGYGGAADANNTPRQLVPSTTGNTGTEWDGTYGSGSGGSGGNWGSLGGGANGGLGGSRGGGGGGGGGGLAGGGAGSLGGEGIIYLRYQSAGGPVVIILTKDSVSPFTFPADWSITNNTVLILGPGGCGSAGTTIQGGNGGGGGSIVGAVNTNVFVSNQVLTFRVPSAAQVCAGGILGGNTVFGGYSAPPGINGNGTTGGTPPVPIPGPGSIGVITGGHGGPGGGTSGIPGGPGLGLTCSSQIYDGEHNTVVTLNCISDGTDRIDFPILDLTTLIPNPGNSFVLVRCTYNIQSGHIAVNFGGTIIRLYSVNHDMPKAFDNWGGIRAFDPIIVTDQVTITTRAMTPNSSFSMTLEFKKGDKEDNLLQG